VILLDAYALVALLADEPAATETEQLLRAGDCGAMVVNLAEAIDVACRVHGLDEEEVRSILEPLVAAKVLAAVAADESTAWRAARLRVRHYARRARPVSLADCFLVAAAGAEDAIATSDAPVARVARAEGIRVIALPDSAGRRPSCH
jgi:predicted nucleic acid-binding protein